jgi:adenylate cyclase
VSEEVMSQLEGFLIRKLGKFILAGKSNPTMVCELICRKEEFDPNQKSLCAVFEQALDAYRRQSWDEAINLFHESLKTHKEDGPSNFYLKLCEKYRVNPPETNWDGTVRFNTK